MSSMIEYPKSKQQSCSIERQDSDQRLKTGLFWMIFTKNNDITKFPKHTKNGGQISKIFRILWAGLNNFQRKKTHCLSRKGEHRQKDDAQLHVRVGPHGVAQCCQDCPGLKKHDFFIRENTPQSSNCSCSWLINDKKNWKVPQTVSLKRQILWIFGGQKTKKAYSAKREGFHVAKHLERAAKKTTDHTWNTFHTWLTRLKWSFES